MPIPKRNQIGTLHLIKSMQNRLPAAAIITGSASAATTAYWRRQEGSAGADVTAAQDNSGALGFVYLLLRRRR
jgi:hypothetical protein